MRQPAFAGATSAMNATRTIPVCAEHCGRYEHAPRDAALQTVPRPLKNIEVLVCARKRPDDLSAIAILGILEANNRNEAGQRNGRCSVFGNWNRGLVPAKHFY